MVIIISGEAVRYITSQIMENMIMVLCCTLVEIHWSTCLQRPRNLSPSNYLNKEATK